MDRQLTQIGIESNGPHRSLREKCKNAATAVLVGVTLFLAGPGQGVHATGTNWLADEMLTQLQELRREIVKLRNEVEALRGELRARPANGAEQKQPTAIRSVPDFDVSGRPRFGSPDAEFAIVEFTDFECPYCKRHHTGTFKLIKERLVDTGKVQYFSMNYPLAFHAQAKPAAIAAECAHRQGRFWDMHAALFDAGTSSLGMALYQSAAKRLELDVEAFTACMADAEVAQIVDADMEVGTRLGVRGTPAFFVGRISGDTVTQGSLISGAQRYATFNYRLEVVGGYSAPDKQ